MYREIISIRCGYAGRWKYRCFLEINTSMNYIHTFCKKSQDAKIAVKTIGSNIYSLGSSVYKMDVIAVEDLNTIHENYEKKIGSPFEKLRSKSCQVFLLLVRDFI